ncbi:MAG: DUF1178 family protein [Desulfatirhabdiaceae bacterium]
MIVYDLECSNGHLFEGWFEDNGSFETQLRDKMISCPVCHVDGISRKLSTFAIRSASCEKAPTVKAGELELAAFKKHLADFVNRNFDNVGSGFATEALKIHYGASEPRNIRGVTTTEEEKMLKSEGVEFIKLPTMESPDTD